MKTKLLVVIIFLLTVAMKFDKPAYIIYDAKGSKSSYDSMMDDLQKADVVMFGEMHENPICHWLELQVAKDLFKEKKNNLVLGAEMFETDNQLILNEYLSKRIKESSFETEAKLWANYKTDYKPLLTFSLKNQLPFIATNVPRRYASLVNKSGFEVLDSLDADAKKLIAPLPVLYNAELKCYKDMLKDDGGAMAGGHATPNLPKAQAIKDATMAHFIVKNWSKGKLFLHFNGSYHSDDYQGIVWYLKQLNPSLKIVTISSTEQENINELSKETLNKADYILCIPDDMTKTRF